MTYWLDTSVVVRLATKEPPELYRKAAAFLEQAEGEKWAVWLHPIHLAEAGFVLQKTYGYTRQQIARNLLAICWVQVVQVLDHHEALAALALYAELNLDYPDVFLAELARSRGHAVVAFDRDYQRLGVSWLDLKRL